MSVSSSQAAAEALFAGEDFADFVPPDPEAEERKLKEIEDEFERGCQEYWKENGFDWSEAGAKRRRLEQEKTK